MKPILFLIVIAIVVIEALSPNTLTLIYYPDVTDILQPPEINIA